jgi:hypothetical protein
MKTNEILGDQSETKYLGVGQRNTGNIIYIRYTRQQDIKVNSKSRKTLMKNARIRCKTAENYIYTDRLKTIDELMSMKIEVKDNKTLICVSGTNIYCK